MSFFFYISISVCTHNLLKPVLGIVSFLLSLKWDWAHAFWESCQKYNINCLPSYLIIIQSAKKLLHFSWVIICFLSFCKQTTLFYSLMQGFLFYLFMWSLVNANSSYGAKMIPQICNIIQMCAHAYIARFTYPTDLKPHS